MFIENKKMVTLHYTLRDTDGQGVVIEDTFGREPLKFMFGVGAMIPGFESNLEGKFAGDSFDFTLTPEVAYGDYEPEAVIAIGIENFMDENGILNKDKIFEGAEITLQDTQGRHYHGVAIKVNEEDVVVNFNHPMAGKTLHFSGQILEVDNPSDDDIRAYAEWMDGL